MSGFVGIFNLDGAPVDSALLTRMTNYLAFRGPDAQEVWCRGPIGLGHALLQVPAGAPLQKQPLQLDNRLWIVADARIDARAELIEELNAKNSASRPITLSTPDAELILLAYDAWGESCVEHLLGDFSFAIWDDRERRVFCARDHFGVKLCYYSKIGSCVIFSNTLNCLLTHPGVSKTLNDLAIADFLLFDVNQEPSTTTFADIRRLPPASTLICQRGEVSVRRYWELSVTSPVLFRDEQEYIEHFRELLDASVADRLRTASAGVTMSGGLDSTTVAASAKRIFMRNNNPSGLAAYTEVFDTLIPHDERYYATLAANALGIPIEYLVSDHRKLFEHADQPEYRTPEPSHKAFPNTAVDQFRQLAVRSPVALTGFGGDPALCGRITVHFRQLLAERQFGQIVGDAVRFFGAEGRFSRLYLSTRWRILFPPKSESLSYPQWLNEEMEKKLGLRQRWDAWNRGGTSGTEVGVRPEALQVLRSDVWPNLFEMCDSGFTRAPVEIRHPFFDLRLMNFLLALPRLPWCTDKELLREASRGTLPDAVRLRRKSPLAGDPLVSLLNRPESAWVDRFEPIPQLEQYVVRRRIPAIHGERDVSLAWIGLRPLSLNYWLRQINN